RIARAADEADPRAAAVEQARSCEPAAFGVVAAHRAEVVPTGRRTPDDERGACGAEREEMLLRAARGRDDEAVDAAGAEVPRDPFRVVRLDLDDEQVVAVRVQPGRDAAHHLEHEGVGDRVRLLVRIGDEGRDVAPLRRQPARRLVRLEAVLAREIADPLLRLGADERAVVERRRDRGLRDSGQAGEIRERRHATGCTVPRCRLTCPNPSGRLAQRQSEVETEVRVEAGRSSIGDRRTMSVSPRRTRARQLRPAEVPIGDLDGVGATPSAAIVLKGTATEHATGAAAPGALVSAYWRTPDGDALAGSGVSDDGGNYRLRLGATTPDAPHQLVVRIVDSEGRTLGEAEPLAVPRRSATVDV